MAETTKVKAAKEETVNLPAPTADVHHMVRAVGPATVQVSGEDIYTADQVDQAVRNWLEAGYKLHSAHYLGPVAEGTRVLGYRILYIFAK